MRGTACAPVAVRVVINGRGGAEAACATGAVREAGAILATGAVRETGAILATGVVRLVAVGLAAGALRTGIRVRGKGLPW